MNELKIEYLSPEELTPYENNTRKHAPDDIEQIKKSILDDGFNDPIGIWGENNMIVEGHGRQIAALELHLDKVPVIRLDHMTDDQRRDYAIRHNRTAELSAWDFETLQEELAALEIEGFDFSGLNFEFNTPGEADYIGDEEKKGSMAEKYLVPPFSVIYCNKPDWLARKRAWVAKGLHSEIGRGDNLAFNSKSDPQANFVVGAERSKAFKNNSRLNGMIKQTKTKDMALKNNTIARMQQMKSKAYADGLIENANR